MAGPPISFSGNQPQPPTATGKEEDLTSKYYAPPPPQIYATPNATISALLPYNGQAPPPVSAPYHPELMVGHHTASSSAPIDTTYLYPPPNPNSHPTANPPNWAAAPPSFPPYSSETPQFSGGYPPNPGWNQPFPAFSGYPHGPAGGYPTGPGSLTYPPPPPANSAYPPPSIYQQYPYPTSQSQPYGTYPPPPPSSGIYPYPVSPPYRYSTSAYPPRY